MKKIAIAFICSATLISGCANMSNTEQRTLSGAGIGAVAGGVGAAIFHGNPLWGAVGGAAVGAVSGYAYDAYKKNQANEYNAGYNAGKNSKGNNTNSNSSGN
jgi:osmotically inducible lipoprotein OsmB